MWSLRVRAFKSYFLSIIKLKLQITEHEDVLSDFFTLLVSEHVHQIGSSKVCQWVRIQDSPLCTGSLTSLIAFVCEP